MQSLGLQARLQQKLWGQERTLLVQESQHLKQTLLLLSLKLRCFLKQWRLGCKKDTEWKDILEVRVVLTSGAAACLSAGEYFSCSRTCSVSDS